MNRREFLHITALGSAAGVMSFTGLGLLWKDDGPTDPTDDGHASPIAANSSSTGTANASPTPDDSSDAPTETPRATDDLQGTDTGTAGTTSPAGPTGTPEPWRGVEADFTPLDDDQEVYVQLKNENPYAVDVTVTITWGYDDGTGATEVQTVEMDAESFWSGSIYRDAGDRTVERWGHELDVEKR